MSAMVVPSTQGTTNRDLMSKRPQSAFSVRTGTGLSNIRPHSSSTVTGRLFDRVQHGKKPKYYDGYNYKKDPDSIVGIVGISQTSIGQKSSENSIPPSNSSSSISLEKLNQIDYSKPLSTFLTLQKKTQSVRNNVDKFQIEQV